MYWIQRSPDDPVLNRAAEMSDGPVTVQLGGQYADDDAFGFELLGVEVSRTVAWIAWATAEY